MSRSNIKEKDLIFLTEGWKHRPQQDISSGQCPIRHPIHSSNFITTPRNTSSHQGFLESQVDLPQMKWVPYVLILETLRKQDAIL